MDAETYRLKYSSDPEFRASEALRKKRWREEKRTRVLELELSRGINRDLDHINGHRSGGNHPSKRAWDLAHRLERRAHKIVETAIFNGSLLRESCRVCGSSDVHAHHEDYSKPLEIVWLCPKHHRESHAD
jgi:hypothetical protein